MTPTMVDAMHKQLVLSVVGILLYVPVWMAIQETESNVLLGTLVIQTTGDAMIVQHAYRLGIPLSVPVIQDTREMDKHALVSKCYIDTYQNLGQVHNPALCICSILIFSFIAFVDDKDT